MTQAPPNDLFTRRVCLRLDGTDTVSVRRDIPYGRLRDGRLRDGHLVIDVYYPPDETDASSWPAVIIVAGYPGTIEPRPTPLPYKEIGWTVSMAQLIALSGVAAIAYTNREPVADLHALLEHTHEHAVSLRIDAARLGVMAVSGNVPTALTTIMQETSRPPCCAVFGYGCLLDLDGATDVAEASREFGFVNACAGRSVGDLRHDIPLFISRAGRDQFPAMNASIDRFMAHALVENLPVTLVRQTLRFLRQHLTPEGRGQ